MDDKYLIYKKEIEKINKRVKEFLWKKRYLLKIRELQQRNA